MKKKIIILTVITLPIIIITTYLLTKNNFKIGDISHIKTSKNEILLSLKKDTLTNKGATFILKNNSNQSLGYDATYSIEIKKDNTWHQINVKTTFIELAYILESNSQAELKINWEKGYGKLPKGEYRLIKQASFITINSSNEDRFYVSFEFTIE